MEPKVIVCLICSFAGLVMVVGGIWLIYKEKIYIDKETNQVTELETPLGKFKTNVPALVLFALGFVPLIYPIVKLSELLPEVTIEGAVQSNTYPVQIYAVVKTESLLGPRSFRINVPRVGESGDYKILYIVPGVVSEDTAPVDKAKNSIQFASKELRSVPGFSKDVAPKPDGF